MHTDELAGDAKTMISLHSLTSSEAETFLGEASLEELMDASKLCCPFWAGVATSLMFAVSFCPRETDLLSALTQSGRFMLKVSPLAPVFFMARLKVADWPRHAIH